MNDDRIHDNEVEVVSMRLKKNIKDQFRKQAQKEHITQGRLFEKMVNLYMGNGLEEEAAIPFSIHLFWFAGQMGKNDINKKIYKGVGIPLYFSNAFRFYGKFFLSDTNPTVKINLHTEAMNYKFQTASELQFHSQMILSKSWELLKDEIAKEFENDFHLGNIGCYHYMTAFRVFKEKDKDNHSILLFNEQAYLINNNVYSECMSDVALNDMHGRTSVPLIIPAEELDLAVSSLYVIKESELDKGEEILRLNRKYLDPADVTNLKNILSPTTFQNDEKLDSIISLYAIGKK